LTERGRHTLGSENHLAMFGSDYLELLGTGETSPAVRADLAGFPRGGSRRRSSRRSQHRRVFEGRPFLYPHEQHDHPRKWREWRQLGWQQWWRWQSELRLVLGRHADRTSSGNTLTPGSFEPKRSEAVSGAEGIAGQQNF
jgi:hypothetical protein